MGVEYSRLYRERELQGEINLTPSLNEQDALPEGEKKAIKKVRLAKVPSSVLTVDAAEEDKVYTPEEGQYFSKIVIKKIPSDYVVPEGTYRIYKDGTYDVSKYNEAVVNAVYGESPFYEGKFTVL